MDNTHARLPFERFVGLTGIHLPPGVTEAQIKAAFQRAQMENFPFVSGSLVVLFLLYAFIQGAILQENQFGLMVPIAVVSAGIIFALRLVVKRQLILNHWSNRLYGLVTSLVLLSMMLRLYFTGDPKQTANLAFFLVGIGMLLFATRWLLLMTNLTLIGWLVAALIQPNGGDWIFYGVVIFTAAVTGGLAQIMLSRTYRASEILRIVEKAQRRELHRKAVQLETSAAVGQRITSILDLELLLAQVAQLIQQRYNTHYTAVVLADGGGGLTAVAEAGRSLPPGGANLPRSREGLAGRVLRSGRHLRSDNLAQDERHVPGETVPAARSQLVLPLKMGDQVLGVLDLQSNRPAAFPEAEVSVYQLLADQVAIALENARLYDQVRQFNQQLEEKVRQRTQALREAYARLERLDKTKSDFIAIASHELRTPLTILTFHNQILRDYPEIQQNETYLEHLAGIERGASRMAEVIESMLDVAKIDSQSLELHVTPVSLWMLIRMVSQMFDQPLASRQIALEIGELRELPEIEADLDALQKVFCHLLMNAIKYTPDGGRITISGRQSPANGTPESVEIVIRDTGIGIDPAAQQLIFEKFYQTGEVLLHSSGKTKFKGGGAGLGLAIARGIVQAHNGQIWVESPGHDEETFPGSAFHVLLPVRQPA